jgi:MFS family permease
MSENGEQLTPEDALTPEEAIVPDLGEEVQDALEVHLDERAQARNALIYASLTSLIYLAAPTLYVGFVQAALGEKLEVSKAMANFPSTAYLIMAPFAMIYAWLVPQMRLLKTSIAGAFVAQGIGAAVVTTTLILPTPAWMRMGSVILHAVIVGCANGVIWSFNWEALARGVSEARRDRAFRLAFGVGPLFAVVGSAAAQLILTNKVFGVETPEVIKLAFPYNFAILFGASVPVMLLAAYLARLYTIPMPRTEVQRKPFVTAIFGGIGRFFSYRLIAIACVTYLMLYAAHMIQNNIVLATESKVGVPSEQLVGYQSMFRFGCKMLAGFLLAWWLARRGPRSCMFLTGLLDIAAVLWVIFAPGYWFLFAFGLNGAGELFGVYYPNYVVCCSPKSQVRRNMAFVMLIQTPVGFAPTLFGWLADTVERTSNEWTGLVTTYVVAGVIMVLTLALVATLPARPHPRPEDLEAADLEAAAAEAGEGAETA